MSSRIVTLLNGAETPYMLSRPVEQDSSLVLFVEVDTRKRSGAYSGAITLTMEDGKSESFTIEGEITPPLRLSVEKLDFGVVPRGTKRETLIGVKDVAWEMLDLRPLLVGDDRIDVDCRSGDEASILVRLDCKDDKMGTLYSSISIIVSGRLPGSPDVREIEVVLPVEARITDNVYLESEYISLGKVTAGSVSTHEMRVLSHLSEVVTSNHVKLLDSDDSSLPQLGIDFSVRDTTRGAVIDLRVTVKEGQAPGPVRHQLIFQCNGVRLPLTIIGVV